MTSMKLFGKSALGLLTGVILILMIESCVLAADAANIISFVASSTVIQSGDTVGLQWEVTGASEVEIVGIDKGTEGLPLEGSLEVWPMVSTSYILIATGQDGVVVSKSLSVNVDTTGDVKIEYFKASPTQVQPAQTVTFSWKVTNGVSMRIIGISDKGDESIGELEDSVDAWPEKTTTYLLEALGLNGEIASASITVNVATVPQPKILAFTASKNVIARGELVTLTWTTENAVSCTIVTSDGYKLRNRSPKGSISVTPNKTKTFTLIAYAADGTQTTTDFTVAVL